MTNTILTHNIFAEKAFADCPEADCLEYLATLPRDEYGPAINAIWDTIMGGINAIINTAGLTATESGELYGDISMDGAAVEAALREAADWCHEHYLDIIYSYGAPVED